MYTNAHAHTNMQYRVARRQESIKRAPSAGCRDLVNTLYGNNLTLTVEHHVLVQPSSNRG